MCRGSPDTDWCSVDELVTSQCSHRPLCYRMSYGDAHIPVGHATNMTRKIKGGSTGSLAGPRKGANHSSCLDEARAGPECPKPRIAYAEFGLATDIDH